MEQDPIGGNLLERIRSYVAKDINSKIPSDVVENETILIVKPNDVYVVFFTRVLNNWRALAGAAQGTNPQLNTYYLITYDGEIKRTIVQVFNNPLTVEAIL